ncbi:MAG TPA: carbohydrate ABC transporter permease, partial [Burkholderiaceae bacterium]|nr:carbohydrate ABC transporter permease [Burkholderiaceae bacterium]
MKVLDFLLRTRGRQRLHWTDVLTYAYLFVGLFMMFAPVLWLVASSFKTESAIGQFPPTFLPYSQKTVSVAGHEKPLPLFIVTLDGGQQREMAQVNRIGILATMVDAANAQDSMQVNINQRKPVYELKFAW